MVALLAAGAALLFSALLAGCATKQKPPVPSEAGKAIMAEVAKPKRQALVAEAFDTRSADRRRLGILQMYQEDWGRSEPCLKAYALLARDEEPIVRAAAITAIAESRSAADAYVDVLIDVLEHENIQYIRVDAADGLRKVHGPQAVEPLIRHAKSDANLDVRLRCVRALAFYRQRPVLDALLVCLGDEEFGIRFTARRVLNAITGVDAAYDVNDWTKMLSAKSDPFVHPAAARRPWWQLWGT